MYELYGHVKCTWPLNCKTCGTKIIFQKNTVKKSKYMFFYSLYFHIQVTVFEIHKEIYYFINVFTDILIYDFMLSP